jgi:hypothetical protein
MGAPAESHANVLHEGRIAVRCVAREMRCSLERDHYRIKKKARRALARPVWVGSVPNVAARYNQGRSTLFLFSYASILSFFSNESSISS